MSENSKIEWTRATVNFWWGCTEVSPACAHCYAREWAKFTSRSLFGEVVKWGDGAPRGERLQAARDEALKLDRQAMKAGQRWRVFANSMSDWLDDQVPAHWLAWLLETILRTPHLDWQLLTKRPQNWESRMREVAAMRVPGEEGVYGLGIEVAEKWLGKWAPKNVWMGTTVEDQTRADERIPALLAIPAKVRFLSCEPLLGPVDLNTSEKGGPIAPVDWVICGGESGPKSRPMHPDWARSLRDQCAAGVPFLFKQWGDVNEIGCGLPGNFRYEAGLRVGAKKGGRLLDGIVHNAFPEVRA